MYRSQSDIDYQMHVAQEVVKEHKRHKSSPQLLPAFLFLLEAGKVDWEIGDNDEVLWLARDNEED